MLHEPISPEGTKTLFPRSSHSFPLPHLAPPIKPQRSLKPRYTPWPVAPREGNMDLQWAAWHAPYVQQLARQGWTWNGAWSFAGRPFPAGRMVMREEWKDRGIDPRLIYRSPSPESSPSLSSPMTASSLLDSPSTTSESSLSPTFDDVASSEDDDNDEELDQRMSACLTIPAPDESVYVHTGGKRKRIDMVTAEPGILGGSEDGDDEEEASSAYSDEGQKRATKRPRLNDRHKSKRPQRRRPLPPRTVKTSVERTATHRPASSRRPKPAHEQTSIVFSCPYHRSSAPHLTCGAYFSSETDVRRHAATHLAKEYYQYVESGKPTSAYMFAGKEPTFIHCPRRWCGRPFVRKDALTRHMAGSCLHIADRSACGKRQRLEEARALTLRAKEHWVPTPEKMPHRVEAVTAKVEGQQKRVITRIVRVLSTYEDTYDVKRVKDGEEMEVWWARAPGRGRYRVFEPAA
ncbi:hypothetical protein CALVIDRAFT_555860 [Calocera viscosa TUFC12733]|uniref:C2H2-type domain-containing protein n=1 Tax=Calocera viscosa (strain TUFC12733) TaxID=1330018 RepID=A0A167KYY2_CALVF|nr:hypothetical protein CALVIDRAFT_555860 [Calocera viscosa TUFC12733]